MKTRNDVPPVTEKTVELLNLRASRSGMRAAAFAVLNAECHRQTSAMAGMPLDLADLPDLPCIMNAADEIEALFEDEWIGVPSVETARQIAADAVAELLAEEGFDLESESGE